MNEPATTATVALTATVLFVVLGRTPVTLLSVLVSLIAASVLVFGSHVAGRGRDHRPPLVVGGLVAALTIALFTDNPGVAAVIGIVGSVCAGLVPSGRAKDTPDA